MTYQGVVRGGTVVLEPGVHLPDGMVVAVLPVLDPTAGTAKCQPACQVRNGVPVFTSNSPGIIPDLEVVNRLRDELL